MTIEATDTKRQCCCTIATFFPLNFIHMGRDTRLAARPSPAGTRRVPAAHTLLVYFCISCQPRVGRPLSAVQSVVTLATDSSLGVTEGHANFPGGGACSRLNMYIAEAKGPLRDCGEPGAH